MVIQYRSSKKSLNQILTDFSCVYIKYILILENKLQLNYTIRAVKKDNRIKKNREGYIIITDKVEKELNNLLKLCIKHTNYKGELKSEVIVIDLDSLINKEQNTIEIQYLLVEISALLYNTLDSKKEYAKNNIVRA